MSNTFKKNTFYNVLYKVLNIVFQLITSIYVARILLSEYIGKITFASNIANYFILAATLGIPNYGIRTIAKASSKEEREKKFSEIIVVNFISTIIFTLLYLIFVYVLFLFEKDNVKLYLYLIVGIPLLFNLINVDWLFQGIENYKYIAIRNLLVKTIVFICVVLFVKDTKDYLLYAFLATLGIVLNNVFNIINSRKYVKFKIKDINPKEHIKPIFIMFASVVAIELYNQIDTTMLGIFCGDVSVGCYSYANRMVKMLEILFAALCTTMLPRLTQYLKNNEISEYNELINNVLKMLIFICFPAGIGLCLVSPEIFNCLYGESFLDGISSACVLSLLIIIMPIGNLFGTQILLSNNQEKKLLLSTIIGAVVNIILNSILIITIGPVGAAISSVAAEFTVLIIQIIFSRKYCKISFSFKFIIKVIVSLLLMTFTVLLCEYYIKNMWISLLCSSSIGFVTYFAVNLLLKNEVLVSFFDKRRKKGSNS